MTLGAVDVVDLVVAGSAVVDSVVEDSAVVAVSAVEVVAAVAAALVASASALAVLDLGSALFKKNVPLCQLKAVGVRFSKNFRAPFFVGQLLLIILDMYFYIK